MEDHMLKHPLNLNDTNLKYSDEELKKKKI